MENNSMIDIEYIVDRLFQGLKKIKHSRIQSIIAIIYTIIFAIWIIPSDKIQQTPFSSVYSTGYTIGFKIILFIVGALVMLYITGAPIDIFLIDRKLMKIGLVNKFGEPPHIIKRYTKGNSDIWRFYTAGVSVDDIENKADVIEAVLNRIYIKSEYHVDRKHIDIYLVPTEKDIPAKVSWNERFLSDNNNIITLGIGLLDKVSINLEIMPHMMVGGATNTGKSVLVKCILYQCVMHGDEVIIVDKKCGVDYTALCKFTSIVTTEYLFERFLVNAVTEMETRQEMLKLDECPNAADYNRRHPDHPMRRIVIAVDEVAEWLDRTGATKEGKQQIDKLIGYLSTLARLGRATNISLILSQQRPDANVLPGQIKAQLGYRIAGRCDNVLSQIILDNADAADKIPHDERGLFLNQDGELFRGFYISDDQIKSRGRHFYNES